MPATLHPDLHFPEGDERNVIWRYMDLPKFYDLISTKTLFLCRRDKLGDPFEGSIPRWLFEKDMYERATHFGRDSDTDVLPSSPTWYGKDLPKLSCVSCWNQSTSESMALWKLYGTGGQTVAIRSTLPKLVEALKTERNDLEVLKPKYLASEDKRWEQMLGPNPPHFKHESYVYESEIRIVLDLMLPAFLADIKRQPRVATDSGSRAAMNPLKLIESIVVGPDTPAHFFDAVYNLTKQRLPEFDLSQISQSAMSGEPLF